MRDAYAALKQDLAARFPRDREAYIEGKGAFVNDILRR
ncbi:MAG: GrpB family protein [Gemmatimonadaceae bacterium]